MELHEFRDLDLILDDQDISSLHATLPGERGLRQLDAFGSPDSRRGYIRDRV
jgi:hypothetical protein